MIGTWLMKLMKPSKSEEMADQRPSLAAYEAWIKDTRKVMTGKFYMQDSRQYVGNDVLFWAKKGGYTTDVSKAALFDKELAARMHESRPTDIPWPQKYIESKTRPAVDMQYINLDEALE